MPPTSVSAFTPSDLVALLFTAPIASVGLGLFVALFLALVREAWFARSTLARGDSAAAAAASDMRSVREKYRSAYVVLGAAAIGVAAWYVLETVIRGYVLVVPAELAWVRFAGPILCAVVGLGLVVVQIVARGSGYPEAPVILATRRTWSSFAERRDVIAAAAVLLALLTTTIAAGMAAAVDVRGISNIVEIPVPNLEGVDPIRVPFFGWAYGAPVLLCGGILLVLLAALLQMNATRPYVRPESVVAERTARRQIATGALRIVAASMLLTLASAWRLIANAGSISRLEIVGTNEGSPYEVTWRFAEFAAMAGWGAPVLEIAAFLMLISIVIRLSRAAARSAATRARAVQPEGAR